MNRERIRNTGTNQEHPPPVENDPLQWKLAPPVEIRPQWKYRPHRWKCGTHLGN